MAEMGITQKKLNKTGNVETGGCHVLAVDMVATWELSPEPACDLVQMNVWIRGPAGQGKSRKVKERCEG